MKLWMVLYAAGKVAGTWGPLPYDAIECEIRRADRQSEIQRWLDTGKGDYGQPIPTELLNSLKTWEMACVETGERPRLGSSR